MRDRDALSVYLAEGWALQLAGVRRTRSGAVKADVSLLENNKPMFADVAVLNERDARVEWADAATGDGRPTSDQMADALLAMLPEAQALLQDQPKESQADGLVRAVMSLVDTDLAEDAMQQHELWHDPGHNPWASIAIDGHVENWKLHSRRFRRWLARLCHEKHEKSPSSQALTDALNTLGGKACFDGPEYRVYTRLAEQAGRIYIDLADAEWRVIEVDSNGWRIVSKSPVRFRRASGMLPLPEPTTGNIDRLWEYLNIRITDRPLVTAWLAATLRANGPYPLLGFVGEQGFGKSTNAQVLRALVDPNVAPLRSESRDVRDLMIAVTNGWIVALDNLSSIPHWISDALCRLATGGGFATRELYSDADEIVFDAQRPVLMTAIEDVINRGDLLDRAILVTPPAITEVIRRSEREFWAAFECDRPAIIGAVLDAVSTGLRNEPIVELEGLPRMADFAVWGVATEPAFGWEPGTFMSAYESAQESANGTALDASLVWPVLSDLLHESDGAWVGTATELLHDLNATGDHTHCQRPEKSKDWPKSAQAIGNQIRRLAPNLREAGITVEFDRESKGRRVIRLENKGREPSQPSSDIHKLHVDGKVLGGDADYKAAGGDNEAVVRDTRRLPIRHPQITDSGGQNANHTHMGDKGDNEASIHSNGHQPVCRACGQPLESGRKLGKSGECLYCIMECL